MSPHEHGDKKPPLRRSSTQQSDGEFPVVTVLGLGFDASPAPFSTLDCGCASHDCGRDDTFDHFMTAVELQEHLKLTLVPRGTVAQFLRECIWPAMARRHLSTHDYLPLGALEALFCKQSIKSLAKESLSPGTTREDLRNRVRQIHPVDRVDRVGNRPSRRRILAILTMMGDIRHIGEFIDNDVWDDQLPLDVSGTSAPRFMANWDENDRSLFRTYQERVFVPFFDFRNDNLPSYQFTENIRLPWLECERKSVGMNGIVHKIMIHPSHHNFLGAEATCKPLYFALKEIQAHNGGFYQKELAALQIALGKAQLEKHLIKLLLTFQHGDKFYLVFEWADGNLWDFWEETPAEVSETNTRWVAEQCSGLARALKRIHGLATWQINKRAISQRRRMSSAREYGRHGDIKATNILWFRDRSGDTNHLVLSDLGLTRYHSQKTRSQVRHYDLDGWTDAYRAPELDLGANISSRYDIWSLGCVYLEFCIWYLLKAKAVLAFEDELCKESWGEPLNFGKDNFFIIQDTGGQRSAVVKTAVKTWIDKLRKLPNCPAFMHNLLYMIEKHMIVVNTKERYNIEEVCCHMLNAAGSPTQAEMQPGSGKRD